MAAVNEDTAKKEVVKESAILKQDKNVRINSSNAGVGKKNLCKGIHIIYSFQM